MSKLDNMDLLALKHIMLFHLIRLRASTQQGLDFGDSPMVSPEDIYLNDEHVKYCKYHLEAYNDVRLKAYKKFRITKDPLYHKADIWDTGNGGWPEELNVREAITAVNKLKT